MGQYQLAIFRHAKAQVTDDEMGRPLTSEGVEWAQKVGQDLQVDWDILLCSPAARAQQTGQLITGLEPEVIERLYTNHDPTSEEIDVLYEELVPFIDKGQCLIVTHDPLVLPLIARYVGHEVDASGLKAGEGVLIDPQGSLRWIRR